MAAIHDIRFERLAREAADRPLGLSPEDHDYVSRHLRAVGEAFALAAEPGAPLAHLSGRGLARHLAALRPRLTPTTQEQHLAVGRLESVYRLLASAVRLAGRRGPSERRQF